jgi:branched-chain amino acid transport system substrate-binding protein
MMRFLTAPVIEQARNLGFKGGFVIIDQARADTIAKLIKGTKMFENAIGVAAVVVFPLPAKSLSIKNM